MPVQVISPQGPLLSKCLCQGLEGGTASRAEWPRAGLREALSQETGKRGGLKSEISKLPLSTPEFPNLSNFCLTFK